MPLLLFKNGFPAEFVDGAFPITRRFRIFAFCVARYIEPFALLVGRPAVAGAGVPELAYRFERFGQRDAEALGIRGWVPACLCFR